MRYPVVALLCVITFSGVSLPAAAEQVLPDELAVNLGEVANVGDDVDVVLTKRSMRSERYRIGTWSPEQGFRELKPFPVSTYRGYVEGMPQMRVNANIEPGGILNVNFSTGSGIVARVIERKITIPVGESTRHGSTGNKVVPMRSVQQRRSPTQSGYLVPPVPMRRTDLWVEIQKAKIDDTAGCMETAVSHVEQRLNDTDMFYSRDVGVALEIATVVIRLDALDAPRPEGAPGFSREVFQEVDGGRFPWMHARFAGSPSRPNYFGGDGIYRFKGAGFNVRGVPGFNARISSGVGHELGHNFRAEHHYDKFDCMNGALSKIGMNNSQQMIRHCMSIEDEKVFPAIVYNGVVQPRAMQDFANTTKDTPVVVDVLENDYSGNGHTLRLQSVSQQSRRGGTVAVSEDGKKAVYTPPPGFVGMDRFRYTVVDSAGVPNPNGSVKVSVSAEGLASHFPLDGIEPSALVENVGQYTDKGPFGAHGVPVFVDDDFQPLYRGGRIPVPDEFVDGVRGKALFNRIAASRSVAVSFPNTGDPGRGSLSVSLWVMFPEGVNRGGRILIGKGACPNAGDTGWALGGWAIAQLPDAKGFKFLGNIVGGRADATFDRTSDAPVESNTWYHLVMIIDRNTKKLRAWVNNEEILTSERRANIPDGVIECYPPLLLFNSYGWKRQASASGLIDEIKIFTSVLTPEQVAELYAVGRSAPVPKVPLAAELSAEGKDAPVPKLALSLEIVKAEYAVLLVGEEEREFVVPAERLPEGAKAGSWLQVQVDGESLTILGADQGEEEAARQRIEDKMARLRQRGSKLREGGE